MKLDNAGFWRKCAGAPVSATSGICKLEGWAGTKLLDEWLSNFNLVYPTCQ